MHTTGAVSGRRLGIIGHPGCRALVFEGREGAQSIPLSRGTPKRGTIFKQAKRYLRVPFESPGDTAELAERRRGRKSS